MRIRVGFSMAVALLMMIPAISRAEGEGRTMKDILLTVQTGYKQEDEFNPLYTQRFGADPGAMEYNGRLYVYMTNDIVEHEPDMSVKENSYQLIRTINCISSDDLVN